MPTETMRRLAKDRIDVAVFTSEPETLASAALITGDDSPQELRISRSAVQHRFDLRGSIIKINVSEDAPARRGHILEVLVATDGWDLGPSEGPGGARFRKVRQGSSGTRHLDVVLGVTDIERAVEFYSGLGWLVEDDRVQIGRSGIILRELSETDLPSGTWDYLTVQIFDCDSETAIAESAGATVVYPPKTSGKVARYSIVADPFGNLIELSQRASLTGPLPT